MEMGCDAERERESVLTWEPGRHIQLLPGCWSPRKEKGKKLHKYKRKQIKWLAKLLQCMSVGLIHGY